MKKIKLSKTLMVKAEFLLYCSCYHVSCAFDATVTRPKKKPFANNFYEIKKIYKLFNQEKN